MIKINDFQKELNDLYDLDNDYCTIEETLSGLAEDSLNN